MTPLGLQLSGEVVQLDEGVNFSICFLYSQGGVNNEENPKENEYKEKNLSESAR